jgi:hypothetical protein
MRRRMHVREVIDFTFAFPRGAAPRPAQREGGRSAVGDPKKVRAPCKRPFPYSSYCHTEPGSRRLSARGTHRFARRRKENCLGQTCSRLFRPNASRAQPAGINMLARIAFLAAMGGFLFGYDLGLIGGTAVPQFCAFLRL